jgi:hypothetical protein
MESILHATLPVFGIIWVGYFLKTIRMPGDDFWPLAEKITYYIFLPSLFFLSILKADFSSMDAILPLLGAVFATTCFTSIFMFIVQYSWLKLDGKRFASMYQGGIRFNNYIGIPIIISLYGNEGLVVYAIIIGLSIPLTNILTVTVMNHYASEHCFNLKKLAQSLATNPLIIGPFLGLICNIFHLPLPYALDMITFLANAASALGLLTVGAGIDFHSMRSSKRNIAVASTVKLAINPLFMMLSCYLFSITGLPQHVAIIYASLPVAASSYILARQFGANTTLMASIIIASTLFSMGTMLLVLAGIGSNY